MQNQQNEQIIKIGKWVSTRLNRYETIISLLFFLAVILKITIAFKASLLIVLLLSTLSTFYFFKAFAPPSDDYIDGFAIFIDKLVSFSLSVSTIGIMFRILNWPGYKNLILMGCLTLIIVFGLIL